MVESKRKKGETFESFLRRFNKRLIQSGKVLQFKKVRYHQKAKNKNLVKASTLHGKKVKEKIEYLKKVGRYKEDDNRKRRRR